MDTYILPHIQNAGNVYLTVVAKFMVIRSINTGFHYQDFRKLLTFIETLLLISVTEKITKGIRGEKERFRLVTWTVSPPTPSLVK